MQTAQTILNHANRIVIKVGSALLCDIKSGSIKKHWINSLSENIYKLIQEKKEVIIVSSGGVALGRQSIGIANTDAPSSIPLQQKQAASAIGQFHMFSAWYSAFKAHNIETAQILLTLGETENRRMHLNARETLSILLEKNIIPVINENDVVSTEEIRFGDNDRLAVRVAQMMDAQAVIFLTTADGLYTDNPHTNPQAAFIVHVDKIEDKHIEMAGEATPGLSTGGMRSKIIAAQSATNAGIHLIISDGQDENCLSDLMDANKEKLATLFLAQHQNNNARQKWIGGHLSPKGTIFIDSGAQQALTQGKSLLPIGVQRIEGEFERGDPVLIVNETSEKLGVGLIAFNAGDARKVIGKQSSDIQGILGYSGRTVLIHRNDMALSS